eukprot:Gb_40182 [translate_table: standard]
MPSDMEPQQHNQMSIQMRELVSIAGVTFSLWIHMNLHWRKDYPLEKNGGNLICENCGLQINVSQHQTNTDNTSLHYRCRQRANSRWSSGCSQTPPTCRCAFHTKSPSPPAPPSKIFVKELADTIDPPRLFLTVGGPLHAITSKLDGRATAPGPQLPHSAYLLDFPQLLVSDELLNASNTFLRTEFHVVPLELPLLRQSARSFDSNWLPRHSSAPHLSSTNMHSFSISATCLFLVFFHRAAHTQAWEFNSSCSLGQGFESLNSNSPTLSSTSQPFLPVRPGFYR